MPPVLLCHCHRVDAQQAAARLMAAHGLVREAAGAAACAAHVAAHNRPQAVQDVAVGHAVSWGCREWWHLQTVCTASYFWLGIQGTASWCITGHVH